MNEVLIVLNFILGLLFILSEFLGLSKCKSNGVVDLALNSFKCETVVEIDRPPTPKPKILTMSKVPT